MPFLGLRFEGMFVTLFYRFEGRRGNAMRPRKTSPQQDVVFLFWSVHIEELLQHSRYRNHAISIDSGEGEMAKSGSDENSVNVALRELMGMEDLRQSEEEAEKQRQEEAERKIREEEERRKRDAEEQQRRAEEEAKLAAERAVKEEEERKRREEEEGKLKIKLEIEAKARAEEQARLLSHEAEVKRLEAQRKQVPKWLWGLIAFIVLGGIIAAFMVNSHLEQQEVQAREEKMRLEQEQLERERALTEALERAKHEQEKMNKQLQDAIASGNADAIAKAKAELKAAEDNTKTVRSRKSPRRAKSSSSDSKPAPKPKSGGLSDDPLGGLDL